MSRQALHSARQRFICSTIAVASLLVPAIARAATGGIYLYLQPLPVDASRLTFTIASVSTGRDRRHRVRAKLNLTAVGAAQESRQRLLASARHPFVSYPGFATASGPDGMGDGGAAERPVHHRTAVIDPNGRRAFVLNTLASYSTIRGSTHFTPGTN